MAKGNLNPTPPASRGIPSGESLWMPKHYGKEIKEKGGLEKTIIWGIEDIIDFIFPRRYQPKYFKVATEFIELLLKNEKITKNEISKFLMEKKYSRSTLENKIIPKLVHFGLVKREREIGEKGDLARGRSLVLSDSLTFTNYLDRLGFAWNMLVSTARQKRGKSSGENL